MLTDFIRDFLVAEVQFDPKTLILQRFGHRSGVFGLRIGDIEHHHLHRGQPGRQRARALFDQDSDETLQAADDGTVQHHGPMAGSVFPHIFSIQALGHREIHLHGAALPLAPDSIFQRVFDLRSVKRAVPGRNLIAAARSVKTLNQRGFRFIPDRVAADTLLRTGRDFVNDVVETEIGIDLLQQGRVVHTFLQDLVFGAKNMAIVLGETAHPHDAVQATRGLVAVAVAKFSVAQREIPITLDALFVNQDVARAVHRLERVLVLLRLGGEHVVAVLIPMPGFFPQGFVNDLRAFDLQITIVLVDPAHVLLDVLPHTPALGMPEHQTRGVVVDMKEIELATQLAVIPLFRLLQHGEMLLQIFFAGPGRTVNPLQHLVAVVAAPVRTCHLHELEVLELAGAGYVRAAAQIFKRALAVQTDIFARRNAGNDFGLVVLADSLEVRDRLITRQHAPQHRFVLRCQLRHALFDGRQVFGRERPAIRKVVEKPVLDHRADGDLGLGEKIFHRIRQQVGGRMADHFQSVCILRCHDCQRCIGRDRVTGIHHLAIHLARQRRFRQARANRSGHFRHRHGAGKCALGTVGQSDLNHAGCHK